MVIYQKSLFL